jgi:DNA replication protein DnaC
MQIREMAIELRLPYTKENYPLLVDEANQCSLGYIDFLETLLKRELDLRKGNSLNNRLRRAKFPIKKYLEDFDRNKYGVEFKKKFQELETLLFIKNKENIILIGTPGCGKTHYSIALGVKACMEGKNVLFSTVPNLIIELKEAMSLNQLTVYRKKFEGYDLVILDELGYVSFDKSGCEILFNLLSNRNDKGSIIITTNLTFDRWDEIFKDTMLTGAIVDRLAHKAHILDISRETSHRFEETISWIKSNANN